MHWSILGTRGLLPFPKVILASNCRKRHQYLPVPRTMTSKSSGKSSAILGCLSATYNREADWFSSLIQSNSLNKGPIVGTISVGTSCMIHYSVPGPAWVALSRCLTWVGWRAWVACTRVAWPRSQELHGRVKSLVLIIYSANEKLQ